MKSYRTYSSVISANNRKKPPAFLLYTSLKICTTLLRFYIRNAYSASIKSNADRFRMKYRSWKNSMVSLMIECHASKHHSIPIHIIDHEHRFVSMQHLDGFFQIA